jgi:branched-chain amino acid transport system permease protein
MVTLPELSRPLKAWRDAWLGLAMVVMMILRPEGLWPSRRIRLELESEKEEAAASAVTSGGA